MRNYPITSNPVEDIDFRVDDTRYALVHRLKLTDKVKTIVLNKEEAIRLFLILNEVLNKGGKQ